MSRPDDLADLARSLDHWHAALANGDRHARIAARLLVDILVAGGLDERLEEALDPHRRRPQQPAGTAQQSLAILRHATSLTDALQQLATSHLELSHALQPHRTGPETPPPPAPDQKTGNAILRRLRLTQYQANLLGLLGCTAVLFYIRGHLAPLPPHTRPETYLLDPPPPRVSLR